MVKLVLEVAWRCVIVMSTVPWYSTVLPSLTVYCYQRHLDAHEILFPRGIRCIEKEQPLIVVLDMISSITGKTSSAAHCCPLWLCTVISIIYLFHRCNSGNVITRLKTLNRMFCNVKEIGPIRYNSVLLLHWKISFFVEFLFNRMDLWTFELVLSGVSLVHSL